MFRLLFLKVMLISMITAPHLTAKGSMTNYTTKKSNSGSQTFGKETIDSIEVNGFVKLDGTNVTDYLQVNGHLKAKNAKIEEMQVNGRANLDNCLIRKKSIICGV